MFICICTKGVQSNAIDCSRANKCGGFQKGFGNQQNKKALGTF